MMNEALYHLLEAEFAKCRLDEEVEDVLLEMAEMLAEKQILGTEASCSKKIGRTRLQITGLCEGDPENSDDTSVYIKSFAIGDRVFLIEDYFL